MVNNASPLDRLPKGRQALGLGLVIAAGLLYISAGFAIKVITDRGASSFLVSYVSSCLFILHLPCAMLDRWYRQGRNFGFQELSHKEKSSDGGESPKAGSPRQGRKLVAVVTEAEANGYDWNGGVQESGEFVQSKWVAVEAMGVESERELTPRGVRPLLLDLLGPEKSSGDVSGRSVSEPQTPIVSVLDAWKTPAIPSKFVELTAHGGAIKTLSSTPAGSKSTAEALLENRNRAERESLVEVGLHAQKSWGLDSQGQAPLLPDVEAPQYDAFDSTELVVSSYAGSLEAPVLLPFSLCAEHLEAVKVAAVIGPLWFMAQYTYTLSLTLTTVSVSLPIVWTSNGRQDSCPMLLVTRYALFASSVCSGTCLILAEASNFGAIKSTLARSCILPICCERANPR